VEQWATDLAARAMQKHKLDEYRADDLRKSLIESFAEGPPDGFTEDEIVNLCLYGNRNPSRVKEFLFESEIDEKGDDPEFLNKIKEIQEKTDIWRYEEFKRNAGITTDEDIKKFTPEKILSHAQDYARKAANRPPIDFSDEDKRVRTMYEEMGLKVEEFPMEMENEIMKGPRSALAEMAQEEKSEMEFRKKAQELWKLKKEQRAQKKNESGVATATDGIPPTSKSSDKKSTKKRKKIK